MGGSRVARDLRRLLSSAFLVVAVLGLLNTLNGYRPFSRSGFFSLPVMAAGMLTTELPLQAIAAQAIGTALFTAAGALESTAGIVGLAVSVVSWAGLVALHREAGRSRQVLDAALGERSTDPAPTPLQVMFPTRGGRRRYCTTRNLAYAADGGVRNQLDIWRRPDLPADGRAPVLLQLHGGAWVMGRKDDQAGPLLSHLAEQGWVCVSANYRLSPKATWPDQIVDVKQAIAWVRTTIAEHGGDPSFVAVTGGSAGGHLSALAALTPNDPVFQPGFEDVDTTVQAAVPMYGLYDLIGESGGTRRDTIAFLEKQVFKSSADHDPSTWRAASPLCRVHPEAPPFLVVHGANDSFLPVEQARAFVEALARTSTAPVRYAELPRAQHAFDFFATVRVHHTVHAVGQFLTGLWRSRSAATG